MSELLKPGEDRVALLENQIRGLVSAVQQLGGIVGILDQYMLLNKKFFDQVKINESETPKVNEEKKEDK